MAQRAGVATPRASARRAGTPTTRATRGGAGGARRHGGGDAPALPRLLYSVAEAGAMLGLSRATAYRLVRAGVIPSMDDYGTLRVPAKWLEEDVERRAKRARSAQAWV